MDLASICFVRRTGVFKLAPIAAVMQFCSADSEEEQLHLSGKRDPPYYDARKFRFKKNYCKNVTYVMLQK